MTPSSSQGMDGGVRKKGGMRAERKKTNYHHQQFQVNLWVTWNDKGRYQTWIFCYSKTRLYTRQTARTVYLNSNVNLCILSVDAHDFLNSCESVVFQRGPADAYLAVLLMNPSVRLLFTSPTTHRLMFSHDALHCIFLDIFPPVSDVFFPAATWTEKTPGVFLVGNSWRGMLLCEQGVRVESRFSGSSLTPCSTIPSQAWCHDRRRVRTRSRVRKLSPVLAEPDPGVLVVYNTCALFQPASVFFFFCLLLPYITLRFE